MFKTRICWEKEIDSIKDRLNSGEFLANIAKTYQVSRQRLKQVANKFNIDIKTIKAKVNADKEEARLSRYLKKWRDRKAISRDIYTIQRAKFRAKKANAIRQGIEFTIDFGELVFPDVCPILGISLNYFTDSREENSISFDRLDSNKGYVTGNVVVMSWRANRIKNDGTAEEHEKIAKFLAGNVFPRG